ncbi:MAG: hypothetical protein NZM29_00695, partial [Nitrospira sp.]|nr:hypothetical protein [Nitrospira sp.]
IVSAPLRDARMPDELDDAIEENAKGPAKASGDAGSVEQHPLPDQIAADRCLASKAAAKQPHRGLWFNKIVPPGSRVMIRWLYRFLGRSWRGVGRGGGVPLRVIRARYDAAATSPDNRRHWANADGLSPNAANSPDVRRMLRNRARYGGRQQQLRQGDRPHPGQRRHRHRAAAAILDR